MCLILPKKLLEPIPPKNQICFRLYAAPPDLMGKPFKEGEEVLGKVVRIEGDVVTVAVEDDEKYKEIMNRLQHPTLSMGCKVKNV